MRRIVRSAAQAWLALRVALALMGFFLRDPSLFRPGAGAALLIVGVAGLLARLDLHRSYEHLFHANLGTSPAWVPGIALGATGTLELAAQLASRAFFG